MNHCIITYLTDDQWLIIQPLIPDPTRRPDGKGRPWKDARDVMNGNLWILLRTGAPWRDMLYMYLPPYQTCHHRRFQQWVRTGVFEQILQALTTDLCDRRGIDLSECYIDGGTFIVAKKERGTKLEGRPSRGAKVRRRSWQYQIVLMAFLSPYTLRLLLRRIMKPQPLLKQLSPPSIFVSDEKPERLIGEYKAYDNDLLDERLALEYGIEMISPHRGGWRRKRPKKTQDGRPLRRYKHRLKIERVLFAWLQNFHRILVQYEYHAENYLDFVLLGCITILLRRCL